MFGVLSLFALLFPVIGTDASSPGTVVVENSYGEDALCDVALFVLDESGSEWFAEDQITDVIIADGDYYRFRFIRDLQSQGIYTASQAAGNVKYGVFCGPASDSAYVENQFLETTSGHVLEFGEDSSGLYVVSIP